MSTDNPTIEKPNGQAPPEDKAVEKVRGPKIGDNATAMDFSSGENFALLQRVAGLLADSDLVPQIYKKNLANCVIALNMAERLRADPLMCMQNLYIVKGKPGWSAKFLIATINQSGKFSKLRYEWTGEQGSPEWGCRAWAIELLTNERLDGPWITWKLANAEGWVNKDGSKWKTMPLKMFMYRAGAWFVDVYAPELSMGLPSSEDLEDAPIIDLTPGQDGGYGYREEPPPPPSEPAKPQTTVLADKLKAKREAKGQATAPKAEPPATPAVETEAAAEEQGEEETVAQPSASDEEQKDATAPDGGMANEDDQRAMLDDLIAKARKAGKSAAAKAKVQGAFKLKSFDNLSADQIGGAIDIITAFLEE